MKVSEVNAATKNYDEAHLQKLVKEMYKRIPKKVRDEKGIDALVTDMDQFLAKEKAPRQVDFPALKAEIDQFIADAEELYYITPNRHVPKKQRPKWRFMVKGYLKDIATIPVDGPNGHEATELFVSLYELLCEASGIYLFNTNDPFTSIGLEQKDLYGQLIERIFDQEISRDSIKRAIQNLFENDVGFDETVSYVSQALLEQLKAVDMKKFAIEEIKKLQPVLKTRKLADKYIVFGGYTQDDFEKKQINNDYTVLGLSIYFSLSEYEEGIAYFKQNYKEKDPEVVIDKLLDLIAKENLLSEWLATYE